MATRLRARGDQPKRGRGDVARDGKIARLGRLIPEHTDPTAVFLFHRPHEKIIEHQLRVVPAGERFVHGRLALGKQAREKERALNLCACDRRRVFDPVQLGTSDP